jgi:phosphinothricin acetyltransferase
MIRLATFSDLEAINDIYNHAISHGFQTADTELISIDKREQWFKNHNVDQYPIFVIEKQDKVVGWLSLSAYRAGRKALSTIAEISYYLNPEFQGQGIGNKLVKFAIDKAPDYNFENLVAILLGSNLPSIKLLGKFNFQKWGTLPQVAVFDGIKVDHLYYGLKL